MLGKSICFEGILIIQILSPDKILLHWIAEIKKQ